MKVLVGEVVKLICLKRKLISSEGKFPGHNAQQEKMKLKITIYNDLAQYPFSLFTAFISGR